MLQTQTVCIKCQRIRIELYKPNCRKTQPVGTLYQEVPHPYVLLQLLITTALLGPVFTLGVYSPDGQQNMMVTTQNTHSQRHTLAVSTSSLQVSLPATLHILAGMGAKIQQHTFRLRGQSSFKNMEVLIMYLRVFFKFSCLAFR